MSHQPGRSPRPGWFHLEPACTTASELGVGLHQLAKGRKEDDTRCLDLALMACVWESPRGVHPVAYFPEQHSIAITCQQMGGSGGRQWIDLMFGQAALEESPSGLVFDLPDFANDTEEDAQSQAKSPG